MGDSCTDMIMCTPASFKCSIRGRSKNPSNLDQSMGSPDAVGIRVTNVELSGGLPRGSGVAGERWGEAP